MAKPGRQYSAQVSAFRREAWLAVMADDMIHALDRYGEKITIPQSQRAELESLGGRVATPEEMAEEAVEAEAPAAPEGESDVDADELERLLADA